MICIHKSNAIVLLKNYLKKKNIWKFHFFCPSIFFRHETCMWRRKESGRLNLAWHRSQTMAADFPHSYWMWRRRWLEFLYELLQRLQTRSWVCVLRHFQRTSVEWSSRVNVSLELSFNGVTVVVSTTKMLGNIFDWTLLTV